MTVRPGWPAVSGAATFQDIRRALAGQVVKSAAGVLRTGILPIGTGPLMVGTASMIVNVQTCVVVLDRNGAVFMANDGVQTVQLSSAPSSGSRWSVVYAKQRETEAPFSDTAAGPLIDKVESTTSETAARNLLPAGARELGVWKIDAGVTTTNAASGVTYTETVPYTAMEGGVVLLRNQTEADAWAPHDGSKAYRLDLGAEFTRVGGFWVASNAVGVVTDGSVLAGSAWDGRSPPRNIFLAGSPQVDGSSVTTLTFPGGGFVNFVLSARVTLTSAGAAKQAVISAISKTSMSIQLLNGSGGGLASGTAVPLAVELIGG